VRVSPVGNAAGLNGVISSFVSIRLDFTVRLSGEDTTPSDVAVMFAGPPAILPVTLPVLLTSTMFGMEEFHCAVVVTSMTTPSLRDSFALSCTGKSTGRPPGAVAGSIATDTVVGGGSGGSVTGGGVVTGGPGGPVRPLLLLLDPMIEAIPTQTTSTAKSDRQIENSLLIVMVMSLVPN